VGWGIYCPCFRLGENLVAKAELPGQGSPGRGQVWDLRHCGKMSSSNCGSASSGGYRSPHLATALLEAAKG